MPTLPGVEPRFAVELGTKEEQNKKSTKRLQKAAASSESVFYKKLAAEGSEGDRMFHSLHPRIRELRRTVDIDEGFFAYAKTLSPAAMDLELQSLVTLNALRMFLTALACRLRSHRDFEAVQTYQNVFLRMHGDVLAANPELKLELETLQTVQRQESEKLLELLASSLGTLSFVRETL